MSNYKVQITAFANPVCPNVREIVEAGYIWPVDKTVDRVVSAEDHATLKRESQRTKPVRGKDRTITHTRAARFSFADFGPTEDPADPRKVPAQQVERPVMPDTQISLMKKNNSKLVELVENLVQVVKAMPSAQPRK